MVNEISNYFTWTLGVVQPILEDFFHGLEFQDYYIAVIAVVSSLTLLLIAYFRTIWRKDGEIDRDFQKVSLSMPLTEKIKQVQDVKNNNGLFGSMTASNNPCQDKKRVTEEAKVPHDSLLMKCDNGMPCAQKAQKDKDESLAVRISKDKRVWFGGAVLAVGAVYLYKKYC